MDAGETFVVDPTGAASPATPENRERARRLWNDCKVTDKMTDADQFDPADAEREVTDDTPKKNVTYDPEDLKMKHAADMTRKERDAFGREQDKKMKEERERERERQDAYMNDEKQAELGRERQETDLRERAIEVQERELKIRADWLDLQERELKLKELKRRDVTGVEEDSSDDECEPNLCDPSVDVLLMVSSWMTLPEDLQSYGRYKFTSYAELFEHLWKQYPALKNSFDCIAGGSSLDFALSKFKNALNGLKKFPKSARAILTLFALDTQDKGTVSKLRSGIKSALGIDHETRVKTIPLVKSSGALSAVTDKQKQLPVSKQLAIREMKSGEVSMNSAWKSFTTYVSAHVCFTAAVEVRVKLAAAMRKHAAFDTTEYEDCNVLLDDLDSLFDACTSWKGAKIMDDFNRIQMLVPKLPMTVMEEYIDALADDEEISELTMDWDSFTTMVKKAWSSSRTKSRMRDHFKGMNNTSGSPQTVPIARQRDITMPYARKDVANADFQDKMIGCVDCEKDFVHTAKKQELFGKLEYEDPKRCDGCRPPKTCDTFEKTGSCPFGENCKYHHVTKEQKDHPFTEIPCRFHAMGTCLRGDKCLFKHEVKRTTVHAMCALDGDEIHESFMNRMRLWDNDD